MQVTRVPRDQHFWQSVSIEQYGRRTDQIADAAEELFEAAAAKAARFAPGQRRQVTLVLDATKAMTLAIPPVHQFFFDQRASDALALGFEDILLVGTLQVVSLLSPPSPGGIRIGGG